jgi:DNA-binding NtrC family response regulator
VQRNTILIVDDEEVIRKTIRSDLRAEGYLVETADSGEEACSCLEKQHFDLVVSDLMMEGIGGLEVLQEAKKVDPDMAVIILTGFGDMNSAIDALRLGADDYLLKPCNAEELQHRISQCLEKYEMRKKIRLYEDILPICSSCRRIRDDSGVKHGQGEWMILDTYLRRKTNVQMSHSICEECMKKLYPELCDD